MRRFRYRISRIQWLLAATLLANFIVLFYLAFLQDKISKVTKDQEKQTHNSAAVDKPANVENPYHLRPLPIPHIESSLVTLVLREFEDFENDVVGTLQSMHQSSPEYPMLVVADTLPYPPLKLPHTVPGLAIITLNIEPNVPLAMSRPELLLKSKYVIILPDNVRLDHSNAIPHMVDFIEKQPHSVRVAAWPIGAGKSLQCQNLEVNLKEWKLIYRSSAKYCDAVAGNSVLIIRREDLFNLSSPFARPIHHSLFIQSSLRGWKTVIGDEHLFSSGETALFTNPHNAWKHKTSEQTHLKLLYKEFGIKLVKQEEGMEMWYGCTKDTSRCFGTIIDDVPDFVYRGRWTPPCCLNALRTTARHVFRILESQGVRYWLEGGSLLGAARSGDIIPWDYDVDIGIYKEDITKSYHLQNAIHQPYEDEDSFLWSKADHSEGDFIRVQYSSANHMHVDIFPFYSRNGTMTKDYWMPNHRQDREFPEKLLHPLMPVSFAGVSAMAPRHLREFLELKFGPGVIENPKYPNGKSPN